MNFHDACPNCGKQKDVRSKLCKACFGVSNNSRTVCPRCGGWKAGRTASLCVSCNRQSIVGKRLDLDPLWSAAFAGLFMGEGSATISFDPRSRGSYHARMSIHMRSDEAPLFKDIEAHLGGSVYPEKAKGNSNPQIVWATNDTALVYAICLLLIEFTVIPARKLQDVYIVKEFCEWRATQGLHSADWSQAEKIYSRLLSCRDLSESW